MKNAYEIRSEVLTLAKDYMDKQFKLNCEMTRLAIESGEKMFKDMPQMYTMDELMKKAQELYSFVEQKESK